MRTFLSLKTEIRHQIWPSGEAENLKGTQPDGSMGAHDLLFQEALAEISKWVECEQQRNVNVIPFCATHFKCAMTVVTLPKGIIEKVYTVVRDADGNDEYCDPVFYEEKAWPAPECLARNLLTQWQSPDTTGLPKLPLGFAKAESTTDRDVNDVLVGRARSGVWAKYDGKIWVGPWIQSNELVVINWRGIKTEWADGDLVNDAQDFKKAVKLYVQYAHERDYGDINKAATYKNRAGSGTFDEALADLIWQCREETKLRANTPQCNEERARLTTELSDDAVTA